MGSCPGVYGERNAHVTEYQQIKILITPKSGILDGEFLEPQQETGVQSDRCRHVLTFSRPEQIVPAG